MSQYSLDTAQTLLEPEMDMSEEICSDRLFNTETITKANCLFHAVTQVDFLVALITCKEVLSFIRGLTIKLQEKRMELSQVYADVQTVKSTLQKV